MTGKGEKTNRIRLLEKVRGVVTDFQNSVEIGSEQRWLNARVIELLLKKTCEEAE